MRMQKSAGVRDGLQAGSRPTRAAAADWCHGPHVV
jgi:hypothetical protein